MGVTEGPKVPPSESDRLVLFQDLARDHKYLAHALPVDDEENWRQATAYLGARVASLRKFFIGRDQVRLEKVIDAMADVFASSDPAAQLDLDNRLVNARADLDHFTSSSVTVYRYGSDAPRTMHDVVEEFVYGRVLHADYSKWQYSNVHLRTGAWFVSARAWVWRAETLIERADLTINELRERPA